jgi:hypothetical protein
VGTNLVPGLLGAAREQCVGTNWESRTWLLCKSTSKFSIGEAQAEKEGIKRNNPKLQNYQRLELLIEARINSAHSRIYDM